MSQPILPDPPGFFELSKIDQIRYLQSLWDRISEEPEEIPVPESHLRELRARLEEHRKDPTNVVDAFEMLDALRAELNGGPIADI